MALAAAAWVFFWDDEKFACADDNGCPATAEEAAGDRSWAADRLKSIQEKDLTFELFYDEDGNQHEFSSGNEDISKRIEEHLRNSGRVPMPPVGDHLAITHVEAKVAMTMRGADVNRGVLVINPRIWIVATVQSAHGLPARTHHLRILHHWSSIRGILAGCHYLMTPYYRLISYE